MQFGADIDPWSDSSLRIKPVCPLLAQGRNVRVLQSAQSGAFSFKSMTRHFLTLDDLSAKELTDLVQGAVELKALHRSGQAHTPLEHKTLAMIFTKASTRTRVSFEVGMRQLGGGTINLTPSETQIGRGEPVEDTARVISSMADGIMVRTDSHAMVERFAEYSSVPVINGLTDAVHPCQLLADLMTLQEHKDQINGLKVAWVGDGNNVCHSWMNAARIIGFELQIATPPGFEPSAVFMQKNASAVVLSDSPAAAVKGANVVVTDTWASICLLYTSPSPRDGATSRMPSSA